MTSQHRRTRVVLPPGLWPLVVIVALWELAARVSVVDPLLLPRPTAILVRAGVLVANGRLIGDLGASALRVLVGFAVAYLLAVPVGIAMGLHRGLARALSGILALLRPLSPPAWIPLAILWFGIGDAPAIFIIFVGTFAALLLGAGSATQHLDEQWLDAAATLGASRVQVLLTVVLPGLLPSLLSLARMGLGLAWMCVIAAEMVAVRRGVGFMMSEARNLFRTDDVMVGMIAIGLIGLGTDALVGRIERTFCRWRGDVGPTLSKGQGPVS